jgi:SAM-dependent methyltransferase
MTGQQQLGGTGSAEFHCWYAGDAASALTKGRFILGKFSSYLRPGQVVDLGCGEGGLLLALKKAGHADLAGVESNPELCALAESFGVRVIQTDLQHYLAGGALSPATYFYLDVIEHVPFELNVRLFAALPQGSRLILQTPNTESILGHQFYMNVPSHLAPYSPWVIRKMLERFGYDVVAEGSVEGEHPATWKNRLRALLIRKVLGLVPELLLGGGNYYVVADRNRETDEARLG